MPLDLRSARAGERIQDPFLVLEVVQKSATDGNPFTLITLGNSTGQLQTEPIWSEKQPMIEGLDRGQVVQVVGDIGTYRDRRQIRVTSLRILPEGTVNPADLLPSVGPVDRFWKVLDDGRREIAASKPRLARVLDLFYDDSSFRARYEQCPAAPRGHHAALGGLLKHTAEMAVIGRAMARASGADTDLVHAGVLIHDIGKLESYVWDRLFDHTERGRLLGHVVIGALMLDRAIAEAGSEVCTARERDLLLHFILSHHGRLEFGAAVPPMTLEAEVLHWADNASAKTASMSDAIREEENFPDAGDVSKSVWSLDYRRVFRGGSDWGGGVAGS